MKWDDLEPGDVLRFSPEMKRLCQINNWEAEGEFLVGSIKIRKEKQGYYGYISIFIKNSNKFLFPANYLVKPNGDFWSQDFPAFEVVRLKDE